MQQAPTQPILHKRQATRHIMMVRPQAFRQNAETAGSNHFQHALSALSPEEAATLAQAEFDAFAAVLREAGVKLYIFQDDAFPDTPDAVFPNNWVTFHPDGRVALYPMMAESRREERREEMLEILADDFGFEVTEIEDLSHFEEEGIYLEGTGSLVLDHQNGIAFAALSERTDPHAFETFCDRFDYEPLMFSAYHTVEGKRVPVYHTNVVMSVGATFAVLCINAIDDPKDRKTVMDALRQSGKKIIEITEAQMAQFAGNVLHVKGKDNKDYCVMSAAAYASLRPDQIEALLKHVTPLHSPLPTIEALGGGSARCMMAEIFLPKRNERDAS